jgi:hypothetical protein
MALWRCPHCGTPQPVAARCWVCRRSSTSCASCRHFRTSVAARIGYCGLDRDREPLSGAEVRSCWVGRPLALEDEAPARVEPPSLELPAPSEPYLSGFVPLDPPPPVASAPIAAAEPVLPPPAQAPPVAAVPDGLLWADLEA